MSKSNILKKSLCLVLALVLAGIAGASFYEQRHFKETVVVSEDLTEVRWLSDYVPNRLGGFIQEQRPAKPKMALAGHDGNIFGILGRASRLLKQAGQSKQADEMFQRVTSSGSYNEALCIISEYVETELSTAPKPQKSVQKKGRDAHER